MNALLVLAAIAMVAGYVWLLAVSFREHIGWGAFVLLLAPVGAVAFLATHPTEAWPPFALMVGAFILAVALSYPLRYGIDTDVRGFQPSVAEKFELRSVAAVVAA